MKKFFAALCGWLFATLILAGCSPANYDVSNATGMASGRDGAISATINALNAGDCATALKYIQPAFQSKFSDDTVRMLMGETYSCFNGFTFFGGLQNLVTNAASLASAGGLWLLAAQEYPSSLVASDHVVEYGNSSIDALLTVLASGKFPVAGRTINGTSVNPGSTDYTDRTSDSNFMLFFATLQTIGGTLNRYGNPSATHHPSIVPSLPNAWYHATTITADGVALAAATINLIDSLQVLVSNLSGPVAQQMVTLKSTYQTAVNNACNAGCTGGLGAGGISSGCTIAIGCNPTSTCPFSLRDRSSFTNTTTDPTSCAAAGVIQMLSSDLIFGWQ